ncbi:hypothetical protein [Haloferula sp. BvORR071]|uniref:hypothetical protein n=1 Tax=Haloferula sp. BvORR071 TaxID=1396141 RepID=UPI0022410579|nr:hypothetical protein [Haloferula sp. BvORR071]
MSKAATKPAGDPHNPYQTPPSALAAGAELDAAAQWRKLRRQLRHTVLREQRCAMAYGSLGVILVFIAFQFVPKSLGPGWWKPDHIDIMPVYIFAGMVIACAGLFLRHVIVAGAARKRVAQLEREHPEGSGDFFTLP